MSSGAPTEAEIQTQWQNGVDLLEQTRSFADGTVAGGGGLLDVLIQSLEGEYTPPSLAAFASSFRAGLSSLVSQGAALEVLTPILYEYAAQVLTDGSGYTSVEDIMRALYEYFAANSKSVESRAITYDTSATTGAGNVGNGTMNRLTEDENGFDMEACTVETKRFRCRFDQNSGVQKHAEVFEALGDPASQDSLLRSSFGSGESARTTIPSLHAGTGRGGSLLRNSSFSTYSASASPKFEGWTESAGGSYIAQDTTAYYRSHPNASTDASLKITGGSGTVTLAQSLTSMRVSKLDPDKPYFLRVMLNADTGSASGGTVTLRCGSNSASATIASLTGGGWTELKLALDTNLWFRNFDEDSFTVEIEWSSSTSGYLLVDDMLFQEMELIDGTYWALVGGTTAWLVDDTLAFTDTGGAPATGKIQWWLYVAGLGYLPSSGTPTFADP